MDKKTFKTLMKLFELETIELLGDAKFAVAVLTTDNELPIMSLNKRGKRSLDELKELSWIEGR